MQARILVLICALTLLAPALSARELPLPDQPHLLIEGHGLVEQVPDIVRIRFEVAATAKTLSAAKQEVDRIVALAVSAAKKYRVKPDNINASKIQAAPQYEWRNQQRSYTGERVSRQVAIKLTDSDRYNALVEALLAAGVTSLQPVQLEFSQLNKLEARALVLALDDAKQQAQTITEHLGLSLGTVFQVAPVSQPVTMPRLAMSARAEQADNSAGLKLGKQAVEQRIRVVYLLANSPN